MKKTIIIVAIIGIGILLIYYIFEFRKFAKGEVDDAKRMDTTKIPEVFNIDSIKKNLDTTRLKK